MRPGDKGEAVRGEYRESNMAAPFFGKHVRRETKKATDIEGGGGEPAFGNTSDAKLDHR